MIAKLDEGFWCANKDLFTKSQKTVHNLDFCPQCGDLIPNQEHTPCVTIATEDYRHLLKFTTKTQM